MIEILSILLVIVFVVIMSGIIPICRLALYYHKRRKLDESESIKYTNEPFE